MQVISARGRVLLRITDVRMVNYRGGPVPFFSYIGDGCGGYGPAESVAAMVATILADAPRARVIGELWLACGDIREELQASRDDR